MKVKLSKALRSQSDVEEKIAQLNIEVKKSKDNYEGRIAVLINDLEKANQINNELKVKYESYI